MIEIKKCTTRCKGFDPASSSAADAATQPEAKNGRDRTVDPIGQPLPHEEEWGATDWPASCVPAADQRRSARLSTTEIDATVPALIVLHPRLAQDPNPAGHPSSHTRGSLDAPEMKERSKRHWEREQQEKEIGGFDAVQQGMEKRSDQTRTQKCYRARAESSRLLAYEATSVPCCCCRWHCCSYCCVLLVLGLVHVLGRGLVPCLAHGSWEFRRGG